MTCVPPCRHPELPHVRPQPLSQSSQSPSCHCAASPLPISNEIGSSTASSPHPLGSSIRSRQYHPVRGAVTSAVSWVLATQAAYKHRAHAKSHKTAPTQAAHDRVAARAVEPDREVPKGLSPRQTKRMQGRSTSICRQARSIHYLQQRRHHTSPTSRRTRQWEKSAPWRREGEQEEAVQTTRQIPAPASSRAGLVAQPREYPADFVPLV